MKRPDYDFILANGTEEAESYGMGIYRLDGWYYVLAYGRVLGDFASFELAADYIYLMR